MVLHPCHKLNYFKNAKWEDDWIAAARQLVRDEFDLSYNHRFDSRGSVFIIMGLHARQKAITFLTTWLRSLHLSPLNFVMSLIVTSALIQSMSLMVFVGGMIIVWNILACQGWQSITLLSLLPLLASNELSARAVFSSLISATVSQFSQHVPLCASEYGACRDMSEIVTSTRLQHWRSLLGKKGCQSCPPIGTLLTYSFYLIFYHTLLVL
ncbi:hypothetical protein BGY98DRAFT_382690 [Russula aff. rugulosa BPL654]|nr:hypothetical protein BGY98DRAFT_382690 [Russula aff. rugulosa BPL654]